MSNKFYRGIRTTQRLNVHVFTVYHPGASNGFVYMGNRRNLHHVIRGRLPSFFPLHDKLAAKAYTTTTTMTTA